MFQLNTSGLTNVASSLSGANQGLSLTVIDFYSGEMPTVDANFAFVPANYNDLRLGRISNSAALTSSATRIAFASPATTRTFNGTKAGEATWFAMYNNATTPTLFIIGTVSMDPATKSCMLINNTNIQVSSDSPYSVVAFSILLA
jgi:hypothetical protein